MKAKFDVQGANLPVSGAAKFYMQDNGILSILYFIANVGGVIFAAVNYAGGSQVATIQVI